MYELVNTSLPNGLIAGTHGFATVAMTRGIPDLLRGRLEALCAYTHRSSGHDASYYQQNPVNWFHLVLGQGEHVVGRVAPSDFDYTGRTNRLARLRVFGPKEMPEIGGAEILGKERAWFSQPWSGDPQYLPEDRNTSGQLRMLAPTRSYSAPSWEALLGANGSRIAQQIAWQLQKNMAAGGKAIYFKTSAAWDVSGEKLLKLFAEVVALLPERERSNVTFSTYPISLPAGSVCHLRGVYDRDKLFDISSATQPWVDCEHGRVVHQEMLPSVGRSAPPQKSVATQVAPEFVASPSVTQKPAASKLGVRRGQSANYSSTAYNQLFGSKPQKSGPDKFIVSLVVAILVIICLFVGFFFWMKQQNTAKMEESGALQAKHEVEVRSVETVQDEAKRNVQEEKNRKPKDKLAKDQKRQQDEEKAKKAAVEKADADTNAIKQDKDKKKASEEAEAEEGQAEIDRKRFEQEKREREHHAVAFKDATEIIVGYPVKDLEKDSFTTNNGCRVYYYLPTGVFTNEIAGCVAINSRAKEKVLRFGDGLAKSPKEDLKTSKNGVVVWYNAQLSVAYFDWRFNETKAKSKWFANNEEKVNIEERVFGSEREIALLWRKVYPKNLRYVISWGTSRGPGPHESDRPSISREELLKIVHNSQIEKAGEKLRNAERTFNKRVNELTNLEKIEGDLIGRTNKIAQAKIDLDKLQQKKGLSKKEKNDLSELSSKIKKLLGRDNNQSIKENNEIQPDSERFNDIKDMERRLDEVKSQVQQKKSEKDYAGESKECAEREFKTALDRADQKNPIKRMSFSVEIKGIDDIIKRQN